MDTVGDATKYQNKLKDLFPFLDITVSKKADALFSIVGAASICAKVSDMGLCFIMSFVIICNCGLVFFLNGQSYSKPLKLFSSPGICLNEFLPGIIFFLCDHCCIKCYVFSFEHYQYH